MKSEEELLGLLWCESSSLPPGLSRASGERGHIPRELALANRVIERLGEHIADPVH
jgi:hypothetical protein